LTTGGVVHLELGNAKYDIAVTHKYWGVSKLNPTNAAKRFMEYEYPNADVVLLGHTHTSEMLEFERGGKPRIAAIGGTFKLYEEYAAKHGIGGRAGFPGISVSFWGNEQEMQGYKFFGRAIEEHQRRI
jgi:hypothetical protein